MVSPWFPNGVFQLFPVVFAWLNITDSNDNKKKKIIIIRIIVMLIIIRRNSSVATGSPHGEPVVDNIVVRFVV